MGFWVGYYYFQTPAERLANALKTTTSRTSPTTTSTTSPTTTNSTTSAQAPTPTTNTAPKTNTATATWQKISQQNNLNLAARANIKAALKSKQTLTTNLAAVKSAKKQTFTPKKVTYDDSEYITENGIDYHVVGGKKYQIISKFPTEAEIASKQFHAGDSSGNNNSLNLGIPGVSNASTSGSTKSASGGKTTTTTSVYDISQNLKDVQAQAKQYGASVALPKTTSYKTQAEAQKALDAYVASTNKALEAKINSNVTSAQPQAAATPTRGYYDGLTPTQRNEVDSWNQNNKAQGINDAINPDWVVWRNYKLSGPEPAKFWKDATNSSARDEYQARMDAEHAESQRQLAEAYAATQKAAGTTHAKSTTAVTNNGKSSSQIYNEQKSIKPSTSKLQVVSAKTVAPSVAAKSQPVVVKKTVEPVVVKKPTTKELIAINSKTKQSKPTIVKSTSANPVAVSLANKNNLQRTQTIQATNHTGQVQLKNGTWIDQYQKGSGASRPNSGATSIFSESAKVHYDTKVANARAAQAAFEANRTAAGSGKLVDNKGYAINQITDKSGNTKISRNTLGQAITISTPVVVAGQKAYYTRGGGQTASDQRDAEKNNYMSLLGAKYRQADERAELLNKKPTADTFVGAKRFKTVDQIKHEKVDTELAKYRQEHKNSKVAQVAASVYGATYDVQALKDTEASGNAYWSKNVTSRVLPTTETFEQKRNAAFTKVGLEDERQAISKKIYDNPFGKAALDVEADTYNFIRDKPVSTAKEVAVIVGTGYAFGAGLNALKIGTRGVLMTTSKGINTGTEKLIEKGMINAKHTPFVRDATGLGMGVLNTGAKLVNPTADTALIGSLGNDLYGQATGKKLSISRGGISAVETTADYNNLVKSVGGLAIGGIGFGRGAKRVEGAVKGISESSALKTLGSKKGVIAWASRRATEFYPLAEEARYDWTPFTPIGHVIGSAKKAVGLTRGQTIVIPPKVNEGLSVESRNAVIDAINNNERLTVVRSDMTPLTKRPIWAGTRINDYLPSSLKTRVIKPPTLPEGKSFDSEGTAYGLRTGNKYHTVNAGGDPLSRARIYDKNGTLISDPGDKTTFNIDKHIALIKEVNAGNKNGYVVDTHDDPILGTIEKPIPGTFVSLASKGVSTASGLFITDGPLVNPNPMSWSSRKFQNIAIRAHNAAGPESKIGQAISSRFNIQKKGTTFNPANRRIHIFEDVKTVNIPKRLQKKIELERSETGQISEKSLRIVNSLAQKQSNVNLEPILTIAPKTAAGWTQPENELFMVTPKLTGNVESATFAGRTAEGIKVVKIGLPNGTLKKSTIAGNIAENIKYNWSRGTDRYAIESGKMTYNKELYKTEVRNMQRKIDEGRGLVTNKPSSYEYYKHGTGHADSVTANLQKLAKEHPHLNIPKSYTELLGKYHDIAKVGWSDIPGTNHGVFAARAIERGDIHSPELDMLTKAERKQLARDIAYHDELKTFSSGNLLGYAKTKLIYRPSPAAKALANADRMDLPRLDIKVRERELFDISKKGSLGERLEASPTVNKAKAGFDRFARNEAAVIGLKSRARAAGQYEEGVETTKTGEKAYPEPKSTAKYKAYPYSKVTGREYANGYPMHQKIAGYGYSFSSKKNYGYGYGYGGSKQNYYGSKYSSYDGKYGGKYSNYGDKYSGRSQYGGYSQTGGRGGNGYPGGRGGSEYKGSDYKPYREQPYGGKKYDVTPAPYSAKYTPKPGYYSPTSSYSSPYGSNYNSGTPGNYPSQNGYGGGSGGSGGNGDRVIVPPTYPTQQKKRRDDDTKKADIKKAVIARDKALISNTKVASFKQMYGAAKKPRPSPFKK